MRLYRLVSKASILFGCKTEAEFYGEVFHRKLTCVIEGAEVEIEQIILNGSGFYQRYPITTSSSGCFCGHFMSFIARLLLFLMELRHQNGSFIHLIRDLCRYHHDVCAGKSTRYQNVPVESWLKSTDVRAWKGGTSLFVVKAQFRFHEKPVPSCSQWRLNWRVKPRRTRPGLEAWRKNRGSSGGAGHVNGGKQFTHQHPGLLGQ